MYAVVQVGGRQYKVTEGDTIQADFFDVPVGTSVNFDQVLLTGGDDGTKVGRPFVDGATVSAEVVAQTKGEKLIIFKRRRRKDSKSKTGFRARITEFKINGISA